MKRALVFALCVPALAADALAIGQTRYIEFAPAPGSFAIVNNGAAARVYADPNDWPGVLRAAKDLQTDIARVTGVTPVFADSIKALRPTAIIAGTLGKSAVIDRLAREGKIDAAPIAGKWEAFLIQVARAPLPGVESALVIAGSDKRGTIYGIYDVSEQIGVSPWYWWADVPVTHRDALYVKPGRYVEGEPAVKYRGIFLNDEAPSLTNWVNARFGTYNHQFYTKVFELILRMKGNFLWPAMWNNAFNEDDPLNPKLADEYGIVMGTSHHEPMLRAQQEWKRHGTGPWDYSRNEEVLKKFWADGVERNKNYESIITLAMRGDGDMPMSESANVALLEKIVADQRKIIAERVNPDVTKVPQVWALYKEVQEYYEKGMRVPDDVTLLWCDDNWGNIRRLPTPEERKRSGGAGIYYHFDYVGGPRNYKWLNTVPITKIWEQMNLAYNYGATRIWIVNVGDLKPMEFPIEFFLTFARHPDRWPKESLADYTRAWAEREFGAKHAAGIADIISKYTKYNGRRKPELLEPTTYSLVNYDEADSMLAGFRAITEKAKRIYSELPENARDAFYQLVLFPTEASCNLNEMYVAVGKNRLYAAQGRASTNDWAAEARALYENDAALADYYNHKLAGGKWEHMMDQTHIGYTYWQQPPANAMPGVNEIEAPAGGVMAIAVEGSSDSWPGAPGVPELPSFDSFSRQRRYIDVFNRGRTPFRFTARPGAPWIVLSPASGAVEKDQRVWVSVDWTKVPAGTSTAHIMISAPENDPRPVRVTAFNPAAPTRDSLEGFVETGGYISIDAEHYTRKVDSDTARWDLVPDYGRTASSMTIFPVTAASVLPPGEAPRLEYQMYIFNPGKVSVEAIIAPTLNFVPGRGLRYAVSFDDEQPRIVDALEHNTLQDWETSVRDSVRKVTTTHTLATPGYHTLRFWMVDPGLVLQKLVIDLGGVRPSYLGPPETYHR